MAIPRETGGSQESSPPGQPNGGQGTREQAADSGSPKQSSILQKKAREGNSSERWPGSQNPGPLESENSWSGGQRACPAQMCAGSRPFAARPRPPHPLKPCLASGGSTERPGLGVRELAQLARFITRA